MNRKSFLKASLLLPFTTMELKTFEKEVLGKEAASAQMPALFVGHGNPMNAITENAYHKKWAEIGKSLPTPKAILCVSAHWMTRETKVTFMERPKTIHDFGGFPKALFDVEYPVKGSPQFAQAAIDAIRSVHVGKDLEWGLDHGCWSVIRPMFPDAGIPVFQLSLGYTLTPKQHFELGQQLYALRNKGVLIVGSGNIIHNLGLVSWEATKPFDWAIEFDALVKQKIERGNYSDLVAYQQLGKAAELSIPTNEHYLPLLYTLGMIGKNEAFHFFNESIDMGSVSMTSLFVGRS